MFIMCNMINRKITNNIVEGLNNFRVVLLNGPRQSGKTTLVKKIADDVGMEYVTLDDPEKLELAINDPKNFLEFYGASPIAIDEIQFAPQLIPYIKIKVDKDTRKGHFLLTGSADFMKMHQVTESLAGRMVRYNLYPLANAEIRNKELNIIDQLFDNKINRAQNTMSFEKVLDAVIQGGYPEIYFMQPKQRSQWFDSYTDSRIQKDILEYRTISASKLREIKTLLKLLATYNSDMLNFNNLAKRLQMSNKTIQTYVELLESMYIVKTIPSYHVNESLKVIKSPKLHFVDTGLASHLLNLDKENLLLKKDGVYGGMIENFVFSELLKQSTYSDNNVMIHHYRDLRKKEVDFVLENRNGKIIGIEVKAKASIKARELKPMLELSKESKNNFQAGFIFYGGDEIRPISVEKQLFYCLPLGLLV
mgnify:CR=1 FL=1